MDKNMESARPPTMWAAYIRHFAGDETQVQIAKRADVTQVSVGRWLRGEKLPGDTGTVALFCRSFDRNPVEGFVAAGMLTDNEARGALDAASMRLLKRLRKEGGED